MEGAMAGMKSTHVDRHGWLPIRIWQAADGWSADWCHFGDRPLREAFFRDSVEAALRRPFNQAFRQYTGMDALLDWQRRSPGVAPTAFVFHASRCGSTLLAQMLARLDSHIVLSEPPPLDTLLRAPYHDAAVAPLQAAWLRALLSAWGQRRRGDERALVVKLDAWNIFELPLLRQCFPATPWIFLYRDPLEIAVSQLQSPGRHMVPGMLGPSPLTTAMAQAGNISRAAFVARALGSILAAGLEQCTRHGGMAVNYDELPQLLGERLAPVFGLDPVAAAAALDGLRDHAKRPGERFEPDRASKRQAADDDTRRQVERWASPPYAALEALRETQRMDVQTSA
jgi:hypothetical protein